MGWKKLSDIEGLSWFIDSDGNLIKIDSSSSIEEFSKLYCEKLNIDLKKIYSKIQFIKPEYKDLDLSYRDLLIDVLGFVLYSNDSKLVNIIAPEFDINERNITCEQIKTTLRLLKINNQPEWFVCKLFFTSGKYENITIEDIIEENKTKVLTKSN